MAENMDCPPPFTASNIAPPRYEGQSFEIPSGSRPLNDLVFTLDTSKGKPWALLKVCSRGNKSSKVPTFMEGEVITGTVELQLDKVEHIQYVTVEILGSYTTVGQDPIPFLSIEKTIWSASSNEPFTPKLKGNHVWPFSVELPKTVKISAIPRGHVSEYFLPPSFSERAAPSYLEYKILVTFRRGNFRIDNVLSTSFAYQPRTRPEPPSRLRQLAYTENSMPLGPKPDPEGWEDLGVKSIVGTIFDSRQVEVTCQFYLAKPLCYSKGTFIPFHLVLGCSDQQTLDLFAARGSLQVLLFRTLSIGSEAMLTGVGKLGSQKTNKNFSEPVAKGIYFTDQSSSQSDVRRLDGEIPVKRDLKSSFVFPNISIKYQVSFPLIAPGFTIVGDKLPPTYIHGVEIASLLPLGPIPRSRAPRMSVEEVEETRNYDISIAMLTAANQRFLHHHVLG